MLIKAKINSIFASSAALCLDLPKLLISKKRVVYEGASVFKSVPL